MDFLIEMTVYFHGRYSTPLLHLPDGYWNCSSRTCEHTAAAIQYVLRTSEVWNAFLLIIVRSPVTTTFHLYANRYKRYPVIVLLCSALSFFFFFSLPWFRENDSAIDNNFQRFLKILMWQWTKIRKSIPKYRYRKYGTYYLGTYLYMRVNCVHM